MSASETPPPGYLAEPPCKVQQLPLPAMRTRGWEITTWVGEDERVYLRCAKGKRSPRVWWGVVPDANAQKAFVRLKGKVDEP